MAKYVCYNGGTESYYKCSSPENLIKGVTYEVIEVKDLGYQTNYTLKGVKGEFNALWFDEFHRLVDDKVYIAVGSDFPVVGKRLFCMRVQLEHDEVELEGVHTSPVTKFEHLGNNIFLVCSFNSTYIVSVG